ncbi:MAG TPA: hypothetical protein VLA96_10185 [Terriglobales bacterium]|nr:hypothetical protein [Terriglobales bacterium]
MTSLRLLPYYLGGAAAIAAIAGYTIARMRRKTPEQRERERRTRIAQLGRITDGTVIDVSELQHNGSGALQLLIYQYDVAGVSYEASQDVTHLRPFVDLHTCRIGVPASVKYDPQNPGNSIVIAESWSGLRNAAASPRGV